MIPDTPSQGRIFHTRAIVVLCLAGLTVLAANQRPVLAQESGFRVPGPPPVTTVTGRAQRLGLGETETGTFTQTPTVPGPPPVTTVTGRAQRLGLGETETGTFTQTPTVPGPPPVTTVTGRAQRLGLGETETGTFTQTPIVPGPPPVTTVTGRAQRLGLGETETGTFTQTPIVPGPPPVTTVTGRAQRLGLGETETGTFTQTPIVPGPPPVTTVTGRAQRLGLGETETGTFTQTPIVPGPPPVTTVTGKAQRLGLEETIIGTFTKTPIDPKTPTETFDDTTGVLISSPGNLVSQVMISQPFPRSGMNPVSPEMVNDNFDTSGQFSSGNSTTIPFSAGVATFNLAAGTYTVTIQGLGGWTARVRVDFVDQLAPAVTAVTATTTITVAAGAKVLAQIFTNGISNGATGTITFTRGGASTVVTGSVTGSADADVTIN